MRITENSIVADFLRNVNQTRTRLNTLNIQLSSQKKIQKPSDDPVAASDIMRAQAGIDRIDRYLQNADAGISTLQAASGSLDRFVDTMQSLKDIVTSSSNTNDVGMLSKFGDQVDHLLTLGLDIANTRFNGRYIFGGTQTTSPPYVIGGSPATVITNGNSEPVLFQVGEGITQQVNVSGTEAFGSVGQVTLNGNIDPAAGSYTVAASLNDAAGNAHAVEFTFAQTSANTWTVSTALPPGTTDATIHGGGTGTVSFDPATGAPTSLNGLTPLVLTPASGGSGSAPSLTFTFSGTGLTQTAGPSTATAGASTMTVFDKMIDIRDRLRSGAALMPEDAVTVDLMQQAVRQAVAKTGFFTQSLQSSKTFLQQQQGQLISLRSDRQDIDVAEIGVKLKQEETMLDAALSAGSKIISKSLLDFLT